MHTPRSPVGNGMVPGRIEESEAILDFDAPVIARSLSDWSDDGVYRQVYRDPGVYMIRDTRDGGDQILRTPSPADRTDWLPGKHQLTN